MPIGRASKQESKGLAADVGNAWFESPVMSREHALLTADFDNRSIMLEDTRSLHGTFGRNDQGREVALEPFVKYPVQAGDIYSFGADVYRGRQTFPPCVVQAIIRWPEIVKTAANNQRTTPSNTFSVPEYDEDLWSDVDDLGDDDEKDKQPVTVIDLCKNSPPLQSQPNEPSSSRTMRQLHSAVIDLTSEPGTPNGSDCSHRPSSQVAFSSSLPTVVTDDLDDKMDLNDQDMTYEFGHLPEAPSDSEEGDSDVDDLGESSDDDMGPVMEPMSAFDDRSDMESASEDSEDSEDSECSTSHECDEDDCDGDGGYDGYHDGKSFVCFIPRISCILIRLRADIRWPSRHDDSFGSNSQVTGDSTDCSVFQEDEDSSPDQTCSCLDGMKHMTSHSLLRCLPPSSFIPPEYTPQPPCQLNQQPGQPSLSTDTGSTSAPDCQTLGDRAESHDLFAAGEDNRASVPNCTFSTVVVSTAGFQETEKPTAQSSMAMTDSRKEMEAAPEYPSEKISESAATTMPDIRLEATHDTRQPPLISSVWTSAGEAFLKDAHEYSLPNSPDRTRLQSPELDMTSAAKFVESKSKKVTGDDDQGRSRLTVKFLLAQEPVSSSEPLSNETDNESRPNKRSWDVFDEPEEDLSQASFVPGLIPASSPPNQQPEKGAIDETKKNALTVESVARGSPAVDIETTNSDAKISTARDSNPPQIVFTGAIQEPIARPAKRQRFSKLAKYASVSVASGFTGAALLFAGLAATAPQII
ncbi:hypothetical protein PFICI_06416 [Pestalotiopsis fici W106-1]|uniref:FHA domain-containing protein n=1 Tax=Pestalotiopsis fici (strain W106-1 / CGMCC3.15140) TaxID=1229662 RepID=W3X5W1_PESFW|nr:uncharacterized protein PFICI_06416 [Pestalotiopsis fici W106-1]ETS81414.1 hypothetical protein PFICI_06416 [Pestalotiopsis fici W106-1]